jgi:hypothetical protein
MSRRQQRKNACRLVKLIDEVQRILTEVRCSEGSVPGFKGVQVDIHSLRTDIVETYQIQGKVPEPTFKGS